MKSILALALAGVLLTGCATSPAKIVFATKTGLVGAERLATAYAQLPRCGPSVPKPCSNQGHVDTILKTTTATRVTVNAAESAVRDPQASKGAVGQIAAASAAALKGLQSLLKETSQ